MDNVKVVGSEELTFYTEQLLKKIKENGINNLEINGVSLTGNKTFEELGEETITNEEIKNIIDKYYLEVFK